MDQAGGEEMTWALPVPAGAQLEVRIYIAEIYSGASQPGQRVFDVYIENQLAFEGVDRVVRAGGLNIGTVLVYPLIAPDETLDIRFGHVTENPAIAGIEVVEIGVGGSGDPVANDDSASVGSGESVVIDVLANDTDDGSLDPASVQVVMPPQHGSAVVDPVTGAITYTHSGDSATSDSLAYTVDDDQGNTSNVGGVSIAITPPDNMAPVAADDAAVFSPGAPVVVDVLANDSDSDGALDPSSVTIVTQPAFGSASVNAATGAITYTSSGSASDALSYTVSDDQGEVSNVASVTLVSNPVPNAADDQAVVLEGDRVVIDVLANDTDNGELDPASVVIESAPAHGAAVVNGVTGEIAYTHDGSPGATDTFTYSVADTQGGRSAAATVTVGITPIDAGVLITQGLVLRLESDSGVTVAGGEVTAWEDQVGALTFFPEGAPAYTEQAINGLPMISFDGLDDALRAPAPIGTLPLGGADRTVFLVARYHSGGPGGFAYGVHPEVCPTDGNQGFELGVNWVDELSVSGLCPPNWLSSGLLGTDGQWMSQSCVLDDSLLVHARNGLAIDTLTHTFGTVDGPAVIGRSLEGESWVEMDVAAVLVYDRALSGPERQSVERYLRIKYLNVPPATGDDTAQVEQGGSVEIDVLANDSDVDGVLDPSSVSVDVPPTNGTTSVNPASGAITYTHSGVGETDQFMYSVADETGARSGPTLVSVSVSNPCAADLAAPFGVLDVSDISAFLALFGANDPAVDFAEPYGVLTLDDVLLFLTLYTQGCP